ncbi:MAG: autoinducer binding domain-containing protein [Alphaproteobacteria bacterium]|nr:autoinducer binding domain-containing protein [Alphaproteobacteria bacterium]
MSGPLQLALDIVSRFELARTPAAAGRLFYEALQPLGANGFGARIYQTGDDAAGSDATAVVLAQILPAQWRGSESAALIERLNPLPGAARRLCRPSFQWSDASPKTTKAWGAYWEAFAEHRISDGIAVHQFSPDGRISRVSVGFERMALSPRERKAIDLVAYALMDQLRATSPRAEMPKPKLTPRERDCLALAAQGFADPAIGDALGIATTTAHFHVENAKRKLGAVTRAQAVARYVLMGEL